MREWKDDIVFLRKVVPGRSDRSYGIQVARLAGPAAGGRGRARARSSNGLERDELSRGGRPSLSGSAEPRAAARALPGARAAKTIALRERLREIDVDNLTPLQALTLLAELKREAE